MTDQTPDIGPPAEPVQPPMLPVVPDAVVQKSMPNWAVGLIVGGGALLLLLIVGVVILVGVVRGVPSDGGEFTKPISNPSASAEAPEQPIDKPADSGTSADRTPLSTTTNFSGPPLWGTPVLSGWDIKVFDQNGVNQFENKTLGCLFTTSQNLQAVDFGPSSDAAQSQDLMDQVTKGVIEKVPNAYATIMKPVEVGIGMTRAHTIEFAASRVDYTTSLGVYTDVVLARSMQSSGSYMYLLISCPTSVMDGPDSPLQNILDRVSVMDAP